MATAKNILLVIDELDMSGAAYAAQNLASGLLSIGAKVMILARRGGEREGAMRDTGAEVHVSGTLGLPLIGVKALALADRFQPDLVHAQSSSIAPRARRLARDLDVPLIVTINRLEEDTRFLAKHDEILLVALSDAMRERLINKEALQRERIAVIPNGLDLTHFPEPALAATEEGRDCLVIGTYGRLTERKGQRTFLKAAARILSEGRDVEFLVMGHGPDKPVLRRMSEEMGIAHRVTFTPSTTSDGAYIGNIDIFVEPTTQEGFGLSVLQAMAAGVPVVASGVGGLFSLVDDGETGLLVTSGDEEAMAAAIRSLLESPQRRLDLARHARERVEEAYSARRVAETMMACYAGAIDRRDARDASG